MSVKSKKSVVPKKSVTPLKSVSVAAAKRPAGRRTYTSQFKREAVELVEREGVSVAEAARRLGVEQTLLRTWKVKFQEQGDQAFPNAGQRTAVEEENRQRSHSALGYVSPAQFAEALSPLSRAHESWGSPRLGRPSPKKRVK